jgi:hypothetical protein
MSRQVAVTCALIAAATACSAGAPPELGTGGCPALVEGRASGPGNPCVRCGYDPDGGVDCPAECFDDALVAATHVAWVSACSAVFQELDSAGAPPSFGNADASAVRETGPLL